MKIGIVGAMMEEIALLKEEMKEVSVKKIGDREYYTGKLYGIDTTLVFSRWGKVASASTATTLIDIFNIDCLIFTGVAGATSKVLNIGDIVIGEKLYQHDMDARPIFKQHEIPLTGTIYFEADKKLLEGAKKAADDFLQKGIHLILKKETLQKFTIDQPKAVIGILASGDLFVDERAKTDAILLDNPQVSAVEMEGAAVAQVCHEHKKPFVVVRTISDKADHSAAIDFQKFVTEVAKYYSKGIVENIYKNTFSM